MAISFQDILESVLRLEAEGTRHLEQAEEAARRQVEECRAEARRQRREAEEEIARAGEERSRAAAEETEREVGLVEQRYAQAANELQQLADRRRAEAVRRVKCWLRESL